MADILTEAQRHIEKEHFDKARQLLREAHWTAPPVSARSTCSLCATITLTGCWRRDRASSMLSPPTHRIPAPTKR